MNILFDKKEEHFWTKKELKKLNKIKTSLVKKILTYFVTKV